MAFWFIAGAMAIGVAALLVLAMLRGRDMDRRATAHTSDIQVYRDQLKEVDRDVARGIVSADDADQARVEISRRLLEADRKAAVPIGGASSSGNTRLGVVLVSVGTVVGALMLYLQLGAPGYPDLPLQERLATADEVRANRPSQAKAEAEFAGQQLPPNADPRHLELVEQLRAALAERPGDLQGYTLLARNEAALGNFAAAHKAQARVIDLKGEQATAQDYADLGDLMILAAGGFVSPEAEAVLLEALRRDPQNGSALYYSGLLYAQTGRPDLAFAVWRPLFENSDPRAPWYLPIRAQIEDLAQLAGVRYAAPLPPEAPALRGPSAEDMDAAQDLSEEDRAAMIENMVEGLSARLANEGGTAEEWGQLIVALSVLGRTEQARAIADEALQAFATEPELLPVIEAARQRAGLDP